MLAVRLWQSVKSRDETLGKQSLRLCSWMDSKSSDSFMGREATITTPLSRLLTSRRLPTSFPDTCSAILTRTSRGSWSKGGASYSNGITAVIDYVALWCLLWLTLLSSLPGKHRRAWLATMWFFGFHELSSHLARPSNDSAQPVPWHFPGETGSLKIHSNSLDFFFYICSLDSSQSHKLHVSGCAK